MSIGTEILNLIDNGGRRTGIQRREFSYTNHVPNRRTEGDRRSGVDHRSGSERRDDTGRRSGKIIFKKTKRPENDLRDGINRRSGLDRRAAFVRALATR
jgi:hypothetical protein